MARSGRYASDRWVTPGVVIAGIITAGLVVAVVAGGVTYLAARGVDPDPMLKLTAQLVGAVGSLGTLVLQLVSRTTVAKTERNTGVIAGELLAGPGPAAPPAAAPPYVVDLDDEHPRTGEYVRVPVPPIGAPPRHLLRKD